MDDHDLPALDPCESREVDEGILDRLIPTRRLNIQSQKGDLSGLALNNLLIDEFEVAGSIGHVLKHFFQQPHGLDRATQFFDTLLTSRALATQRSRHGNSDEWIRGAHGVFDTVKRYDTWLHQFMYAHQLERDIFEGTNNPQPGRRPLHEIGSDLRPFMNERDRALVDILFSDQSAYVQWLCEGMGSDPEDVGVQELVRPLTPLTLIDYQQLLNVMRAFIASIRFELAIKPVLAFSPDILHAMAQFDPEKHGWYASYLDYVCNDVCGALLDVFAPAEDLAFFDMSASDHVNVQAFFPACSPVRNGSSDMLEYVLGRSSFIIHPQIQPLELLCDIPMSVLAKGLDALTLHERSLRSWVNGPQEKRLVHAINEVTTRIHHTIAQALAHVVHDPDIALPQSMGDCNGSFIREARTAGRKHLETAQAGTDLLGHDSVSCFPELVQPFVEPIDHISTMLHALS